MKTTFEDLEAELRALPPRRPSELLAARVEQAVATERAARRKRRWLMPLAAAAAVTAILVPLLTKPSEQAGELAGQRAVGTPGEPAATNRSGVPTPAETAPDQGAALEGFTRLAEANYLYAAEDDGILFASTTMPLRRIRYQYLDTTDWRDEQAQAVVRVVVPREDVVLVPLNVY